PGQSRPEHGGTPQVSGVDAQSWTAARAVVHTGFGVAGERTSGRAPMNCQSHLYRGLDPKLVTRRWFFQQCGVGLGAIALGTLFRESGWASPAALASPLALKQPHFPGKARRVIFLF